MDPPPAETLIKALEELYALGALNDRYVLGRVVGVFWWYSDSDPGGWESN